MSRPMNECKAIYPYRNGCTCKECTDKYAPTLGPVHSDASWLAQGKPAVDAAARTTPKSLTQEADYWRLRAEKAEAHVRALVDGNPDLLDQLKLKGISHG